MISRKPLKHIHWFSAYGPVSASTRYRAIFPLEYLKVNKEITHDIYIPSRSIRGLLFLIKQLVLAFLSNADTNLIVIQKICSNGPYSFLLKILVLLKSNTLLDLDDAEYLRKNDRSLIFFIKNCSKCTVGSKPLMDYCSKLNKAVYLSTSPVINHGVIKNVKERDSILHLGWVGDFGNGHVRTIEFSHKKSLYDILFPAIVESEIKIKLTLLGVKNTQDIPDIFKYFNNNKNVELSIPSNLNWEDDSWVYPLISSFDFGVSPMIDHPFNQAKSAFKAKQYLSVGIPVIASDVGGNAKFVSHGKSGFICQTKDDFKKAIIKANSLSTKTYRDWSNYAINTKDSYNMETYCAILYDAHGGVKFGA